MRRLLLLGLLFLSGTTQAFFVGDGLERINQRVVIEVTEDERLLIEIHETIRNNSDQNQDVVLWYPLRPNAQDVRFFVDSQARLFDTLTGQDRLELLFDQAQKHQDHRFFRLGGYGFPTLFQSQPLVFTPGKTLKTKLSYEARLDFMDDWFLGEIFLDDGIAAEHFEMSLSISSAHMIRHWLVPFSTDALIDRQDKRLIWFVEEDDFVPSQNIAFFWSSKESPTLQFPFLGKTYRASFFEIPERKEMKEVLFLIDRSGSLLGGAWKRTEEWLRFLFEHLGEEVQIRVVFFDDGIHEYNDSFEDNTFSFRKKFFHSFSTTQPVGKTNLSQAFDFVKDLWSVPEKNRILFLFTDNDVFIPTEKINAPMITMYFSDNISAALDLSSRLSGGFSQRLFREALSLIEKDDWLDLWNYWRPAISRDPELEVGSDVLPDEFKSSFSPHSLFWIGRTEITTEPFSSVAQFLPSVWGARQIAHLLRERNFSDSRVDDILAVGRIFGIKTSFFDEWTDRQTLRSRLEENKDSHDLARVIMDLERSHGFFSADVQKINGIPFYQNSSQIWQPFNFGEIMREDTLIEIAPFSEAQREFWLRFSDRVGRYFSVGEEVDFCSGFPCVSVKKGASEEFQIEDIVFFIDDYRDHWGQQYLVQGIKEGLLEPDEEGNLLPDEPLSRGEFAQMIWKHLFGASIPYTTNDDFFADTGRDSEFFNAVTKLRQKGIVGGYVQEDGIRLFRPDNGLTRAEAVKILLASDGFFPHEDNDDEAVFSDSRGWEKPWINEAFRRGMIQGIGNGKFAPHEALTRVQALKLIFSFD